MARHGKWLRCRFFGLLALSAVFFPFAGGFAQPSWQKPQPVHWRVRQALLDWDTSELKIAQRLAADRHPGHPLNTWLKSYVLLLSAQLPGMPGEVTRFLAEQENLISALAPPAQPNPLYLLCRAELHLHRARLHVASSSWWSAAYQLRQYFQLLESARKTYPSFERVFDKSLYPVKLLLGLSPERFHGLMRWFGLPPETEMVSARFTHTSRSLDTAWGGFFLEEHALLVAYTLYHLDRPASQITAWSHKAVQRCDGSPGVLMAYLGNHFLLQNHLAESAFAGIYQLDCRKGARLPAVYRICGRHQLYMGHYREATLLFNRYLEATGLSIEDDCYLARWRSWAEYLANENATKKQASETPQLRTKCTGNGNLAWQMRIDRQQFSPYPEALLEVRIMLEAGRYEEAARLLEHTTQPDKSSAVRFLWWYEKARAAQALEQWQAARTCFQKAIRAGYKFDVQGYRWPAAHVFLGEVLVRQEDWDGAKTAFHKAGTFRDYPFEEGLQRRIKRGLAQIARQQPLAPDG